MAERDAAIARDGHGRADAACGGDRHQQRTQRVGGARTAPMRSRSIFAEHRPRGLFGHDTTTLTPNGSGHPHDYAAHTPAWAATEDDRGHRDKR